MFFSKTTGGFYDGEIHGTNIPADAVEILFTEYAALIEGQSTGLIIAADTDGKPYLAQPPKPSIAELWQLIQSERDRRKNGGFLLDGKWYHSDPESLTRYLGLIQLGANVPNRQWKTMDGSLVPMTQQLAQAIFNAAVAHDAACFDTAEAHKAAMEVSADPSAYDFSSGWPSVYGSP